MPRKPKPAWGPRRLIREAREALGFTAQDMANILGIGRQTLYLFETGQSGYDAKSRSTLRRICKWLREEAGRQAEARKAEWLAGFEEGALCPEENLSPYKYDEDTSSKETE